MCETHIHCFFLVVAASSNCIFCRFRPWDVSRSRACIFVWVYCNWWLHFLYSLVSSLKVPHWYIGCYGYSVSALRRNSAPEIALTFCYLVCRLKLKASKRTGGVPELHCKPSKHKKESTEDKICLEIIPQNYLNSDIFFGVEKKSESIFFSSESKKYFFSKLRFFQKWHFSKIFFFRMDFFDYFFFAQNFLGVQFRSGNWSSFGLWGFQDDSGTPSPCLEQISDLDAISLVIWGGQLRKKKMS